MLFPTIRFAMFFAVVMPASWVLMPLVSEWRRDDPRERDETWVVPAALLALAAVLGPLAPWDGPTAVSWLGWIAALGAGYLAVTRWVDLAGLVRWQVFILVASYVFYGNYDWHFVVLLATSTVINQVVTVRLHRTEPETTRRTLLVIGVLLNLGLLAWFKYKGSGMGLKFRMHPFAAALARCQMTDLEERNEAGARQVRRLNDALTQLPGLYEQSSGRKDMTRLYYAWNMLFIDEQEAGVPRAAVVKALKAEGVNASEHYYTLQHELPVYTEAEWWHHLPQIPELPGSRQANATGIALPYFTNEVPELVDQYIAAFEKVWANRKKLTA